MNMQYKNYEIEISSTEGWGGRWEATAKVTPSISNIPEMKDFRLCVGGFNSQVGAEVEVLLKIKRCIDHQIDPDKKSNQF